MVCINSSDGETVHIYDIYPRKTERIKIKMLRLSLRVNRLDNVMHVSEKRKILLYSFKHEYRYLLFLFIDFKKSYTSNFALNVFFIFDSLRQMLLT